MRLPFRYRCRVVYPSPRDTKKNKGNQGNPRLPFLLSDSRHRDRVADITKILDLRRECDEDMDRLLDEMPPELQVWLYRDLRDLQWI